MPARNDEAHRTLVLAGLLAFGREAPRRDPVLATLGGAAMRMIDRIHGDAAVVRHAARPTLASGLADGGVHVVRIGNRANCRHATAVHETLLGRAQAQDHVVLVAADNLHVAAGRTRDLSALADLDFNVVHNRATGIFAIGIALPGFTSACSEAITESPGASRCGAKI